MANFMLTMNGRDITSYDIPKGQTVKLVQWGGDASGNKLMLGIVPPNPALTMTPQPDKLGAASTAFNITGNTTQDGVEVAAMVSSTGWRYCEDLVVNVKGEPQAHPGYQKDLLYELATSGDAVKVDRYREVMREPDPLLTQNMTHGSYNCGTKSQNYGPEVFGRPVNTNYFSYYKPFKGAIERKDLTFDPGALSGAIARIQAFLDKGTPVRVWLAHDNIGSGGADSDIFAFTNPITLQQATHFVLIVGYSSNRFLYIDPWPGGSILAYDGGVYPKEDHYYLGELEFDRPTLEFGIQKAGTTGGNMIYTVIAGP